MTDPPVAIQVPTAAFQRAGLQTAVAELRPVLESLGEKVATRAADIQGKLENARTTCMRRGLDQMLQELVVVRAEEEVFPMIEPRVLALGLPKVGGLDKMVLKLCFEMVEGMARKGIHGKVLEGYAVLMAELQPAVAGANAPGIAPEDGEELEEDEFGFLVSEGGYKAYKGSAGFGGLDPQAIVKQVLDAPTAAKLTDTIEMMEALLLGYEAKAAEVMKDWQENAGGLALLDEAGEDPEKLARIEAPTAECLKAGLAVGMQQLIPKLQAMGGELSERANEIYISVATARSTDMRRGLDQMMQEVVVRAARERVFPVLESKIAKIKLPPIGGVKVLHLLPPYTAHHIY
jgi:hypothetical protein